MVTIDADNWNMMNDLKGEKRSFSRVLLLFLRKYKIFLPRTKKTLWIGFTRFRLSFWVLSRG